MKKYQYMKISFKYTTAEIMAEYKINNIASNGYIYVEIRKEMYGLKEAGIIAFQRLVEKLAPHGYRPFKHTPGLWEHMTRNIMLTLAVGNFGIKYFKDKVVNYLYNTLRQNYQISNDQTGRHYYGLTIDWYYTSYYVDISMPGYVMEALKNSLHITSKTPTCAT